MCLKKSLTKWKNCCWDDKKKGCHRFTCGDSLVSSKKPPWLPNGQPPSITKIIFHIANLRFRGHQRPYLAEIHENGGVCGHQGPYFTQIQLNNHDIFKIRASVSG